MYHYLFTNDIRISVLDTALKEAARRFITETVPSASENKSANNNMKTLGFYFNLTADSNCAKIAADGDVRTVVLNFIKKFQFPNLRTSESYEESKNDGIIIAPMRTIVKVLFIMNSLSEGFGAYLTREEIRLFIMYNDKIAKQKKHDYIQLIADIKNYRKTGSIPEYISDDTEQNFWKQEERQIRELTKILTWSGCVTEIEEGKLVLANEELSVQNKAAIFDIITFNDYWNGTTLKEYQQYMDIKGTENSHEILDTESDDRQGGVNELYYGVPGSGKSYKIDNIVENSEYERVVFHPDYTYSDFVGQIMPRLKRNADGTEKLTYEFVPGPFTKALKAAVKNKDSMHYLVIEEINRGNAPAIFGDVFQLLDRNEDGSGKYHITNFDIGREVYDGNENAPISIPSNLSILATMNTSDQNVFTLDTAFQRRWNMKYIENNVAEAEHADEKIEYSDVTWGGFASAVNEEILEYNAELSSSEDKQLGAYFVTRAELASDKFPEKALKYLWDDAFKLEREKIFRPEIKSVGDLVHSYDVEIQNDRDPIKGVMRAEVYRKMMDMSAYGPEEAIDESEIFEAEINDGE